MKSTRYVLTFACRAVCAGAALIFLTTGPRHALAQRIDHSQGFADHSDLVAVGNAFFTQGLAFVTDDKTNQLGAIWSREAIKIHKFTCDFTLNMGNLEGTPGEGMTFCIQSNGNGVTGDGAGELGYGGADGLLHSVCVKFDIFDNQGEGNDSTGLFTGGVAPTVPAIDLTHSGIDLYGRNINVHMVYHKRTLTVTLTDSKSGARAVQTYPIDIPATVGSKRAFVGFTGSTSAAHVGELLYEWFFVGK